MNNDKQEEPNTFHKYETDDRFIVKEPYNSSFNQVIEVDNITAKDDYAQFYTDCDNYMYLVNEEVVSTEPSSSNISFIELNDTIKTDVLKHGKERKEVECVAVEALRELGANCSSGNRAYYGDTVNAFTNRNNNQNILLTCSICGATFNKTQALIRHIKIKGHHIIEKPNINLESLKTNDDIPYSNLWNPDFTIIVTEPSAIISEFSQSPKSERIDKQKPHICRYCGLGFTREKALESHERIHENEQWKDALKCNNCSKSFTLQSQMMKHIMHCVGVRKKCKKKNILEASNIKSISTESIKEKTRTSPSIKQGKHSCLECSKVFLTKQKMYRHMWIHRKKSFTCEVCASSYDQQQELDEHRLSQHSEESPYFCSECGKNFASRQGLWEHNRIHNVGSLGAFNCLECNKSFASRQGYLIHNRSHTGERPYVCVYCLKAFRDGGTLKKHERIHTGERPHKCPLCPKSFNQKVVLREHVRWVHASNKNEYPDPSPYACLLCKQFFTEREELCAHIVRHSDQLAAFFKTNLKNKNVDVNLPIKEGKLNKEETVTIVKGSKCDPNVVLKNRIILKKCKGFLKTKIENYSSEEKIQEDISLAKHECELCSLCFTSKESLLSHVKIHI